jgi:glucose/arabinose dehydrogenase
MPAAPPDPIRTGRRRLAAALALLLAGPAALPARAQETIPSEGGPLRLDTVATGLSHPWGAAFLPDRRLLVTERAGRLRLVAADGTLSAPLSGLPSIEAGGQGGLLDIALAPDFADTRQLYFCQAALTPQGALTRLVRARLDAQSTGLEQVTPLLDATPAQPQGRNHFGCRIVFAPDGHVFLSTGDRFVTKMRGQRLDDLAGKVLRLTRDGAPAPGNPFLGQAGVRPEIWSYGHRNPQGLAFNPATGSLWEAEFGPRGGDEVNIIRPGVNYGWPIVTHGIDYDGSRIGEGASRPDLQEPERFWTPVISPSGAAFYTGDLLPGWKGNLFLAGLNPPGLTRLTLQGDTITGEERLLRGRARLRHVLQGPDGALYLLTDEASGRVLRLSPG